MLQTRIPPDHQLTGAFTGDFARALGGSRAFPGAFPGGEFSLCSCLLGAFGPCGSFHPGLFLPVAFEFLQDLCPCGQLPIERAGRVQSTLRSDQCFPGFLQQTVQGQVRSPGLFESGSRRPGGILAQVYRGSCRLDPGPGQPGLNFLYLVACLVDVLLKTAQETAPGLANFLL